MVALIHKGRELTTKRESRFTSNAYVAFLFADLRGFTQFTREKGDEAAYRLVRQFYRLVKTRSSPLGGREWKREGDEVLLAFPTAYQATRAAIAVMKAIEAYNNRNPEAFINAGIGLDAGEPIENQGDFIGTVVNRTARITAIAKQGQILATDSVRELTSNHPNILYLDRGSHALRGFEQRQRLYELAWRRSASGRVGSPTSKLLFKSDGLRRLLGPKKALIALAAPVLMSLLLPAMSGAREQQMLLRSLEPTIIPIADAISTTKGIPQIVAASRRFTVLVMSKNNEDTKLGTGVIYDRSGLVVTAAHIVEGVDSTSIYFDDGTKAGAKVLARSERDDLAVLQLPSSLYAAATFGDSSKTQPGQEVVMLGYPVVFALGTHATITWGMVSQTASGPGRQYLQIAAEVNPGDSGGPLIDREGNVIGINIGRIESSRGQAIQGIGFALPSQIVQEFLREFRVG